jgi:thioredoxin reductase
MLSLFIVGGGIHGALAAVHASVRYGLPLSSIALADPSPVILHTWKQQLKRVGAECLRSTRVHHLHPDAFHLERYARKHGREHEICGWYGHPSAALFNDHSEAVLAETGVSNRHLRTQVLQVYFEGDHWTIFCSNGSQIKAKSILAATGSGQPHIPSPLQDLYGEQGSLVHVLDLTRPMPCAGNAILIVGSGMSAAQTALQYVNKGSAVTLLHQKPWVCADFDAAPGWMGPKYLSRFVAETDYLRRLRTVREARQKGTLPASVFRQVLVAAKSGRLTLVQAGISAAEWSNDIFRVITTTGTQLFTTTMVLATGFSNSARPQLPFLVTGVDLARNAAGWPLLSKSLAWVPGLFVSGPLAELEVGPVCRTIQGARLACARFMPEVIQRSEHNQTVETAA